MKKLLLTLLMITAGVSVYGQEKFTIGGGGGLLAVDGESGYNFNLFTNYKVWKDVGLGVDTWYGEVEDTNLLSAHLVGEFYFSKEFLDIDNLTLGTYVGPGIVQVSFDEIDVTEDYFSFLSGVNINYNLSSKLSLGLRTSYQFTDNDLGDNVITCDLYLSYSF